MVNAAGARYDHEENAMKRAVELMLVLGLLVASCGCCWWGPEGEGYGHRGRGEYERRGGGDYDHRGGGYGSDVQGGPAGGLERR